MAAKKKKKKALEQWECHAIITGSRALVAFFCLVKLIDFGRRSVKVKTSLSCMDVIKLIISCSRITLWRFGWSSGFSFFNMNPWKHWLGTSHFFFFFFMYLVRRTVNGSRSSRRGYAVIKFRFLIRTLHYSSTYALLRLLKPLQLWNAVFLRNVSLRSAVLSFRRESKGGRRMHRWLWQKVCC